MATIRKNIVILAIMAVLFIILGVAVQLTFLFANYPGYPNMEDNIRVEIVKSLLQLIVVIIIGGFVTALFKLAEQSRERSHLRSEIRTEYLKRLSSLYRSAKAARRTLRVEGLTSKYNKKPISIPSSKIGLYKEQMERINEVQLELEGIKIESNYLPEFISLKGVSNNLGFMEKYLGMIITEFEEIYPLLQNGQIVKPDQLKRLSEFTGKINRKLEPGFVKSFSDPYAEAIKSISESLI